MTPERHSRIWVPVLVGVLGLALTFTAWWLLVRRENELLTARFQLQSEERFRAIEAKLTETLGTVYVPQAFYEAAENIQADEFRAFVLPLSNRYAGVRAFLWAPLGDDSKRNSPRVAFAEPRE